MLAMRGIESIVIMKRGQEGSQMARSGMQGFEHCSTRGRVWSERGFRTVELYIILRFVFGIYHLVPSYLQLFVGYAEHHPKDLQVILVEYSGVYFFPFSQRPLLACWGNPSQVVYTRVLCNTSKASAPSGLLQDICKRHGWLCKTVPRPRLGPSRFQNGLWSALFPQRVSTN